MALAGTAWKVAKNTIGLPLTRPKTFMFLAGTTALAGTMAVTGLPLGQAFGAVAGGAVKATVGAVSTAVPYVWNAGVAAAPGVWDGAAQIAADGYIAAVG